MTLPEAFCRINRARGMELISPEDLLNACQKLEKIASPIRFFNNFTLKVFSFSLYTFDDGVTVVQLRTLNTSQMTEEVMQLIESAQCMDANQLAKTSGISLVLASER